MPNDDGTLTPQELRDRWKTPEGQAFRREIIRQLQEDKQVDWENLTVVVGGKESRWVDFPGVKEILGLNYSDMRCWSIDPKIFKKVNLASCDLSGAKIDYCNFSNSVIIRSFLNQINAIGCIFKKTNLTCSQIMYSKLDKSEFDDAILRKCHFEGTDLSESVFFSSNLQESYFEGANLKNCNFDGANLNGAKFTFKSFRYRISSYREKIPDTILLLSLFLSGILAIQWPVVLFHWFMLLMFYMLEKPQNEHPTELYGAELKNVRLDSDPVLYRRLLDEQYLDTFAERHPWVYAFWVVTSDCGRKTRLLFLWTVYFGLLFGFIYQATGLSYTAGPMQWWHPFYFSFVTMTTLGMASVEPVTGAAAFWHTVQNLLGFALLGYFVAVLGDKFTRRSA